MTAYMRWAVDNVLVYSPIGAVVPPELRMPGGTGTACRRSRPRGRDRGRGPSVLSKLGGQVERRLADFLGLLGARHAGRG